MYSIIHIDPETEREGREKHKYQTWQKQQWSLCKYISIA